MKQAKVHLDGTERSGPLHRSLCGYFNVAVTSDATEASCKVCLALLRRGTRARDHFVPAHASNDVAHLLHVALERELPKLAPTAGPPPRLTAPLWDASCRGAEHRRCGDCELCAWEREAERFSFASPWTKQHQLARAEGAPRWGSLNQALLAMLEHEASGRVGRSALGGQLDRLARGDSGGERDPRKVVRREVVAANDVVHVQVALERAYADGWEALSAAQCARVLLERTPGANEVVSTFNGTQIPSENFKTEPAGVTAYEVLAAHYGVGEATLRAVVKQGRRAMTEDLATRGLIPARGLRARQVVEASTWREVPLP